MDDWASASCWQLAAAGEEGRVRLFGEDILALPWEPAGEKVWVRDPRYGDLRAFSVYTAEVKGVRRTFAAGEFSSGVWGFFFPSLRSFPAERPAWASQRFFHFLSGGGKKIYTFNIQNILYIYLKHAILSSLSGGAVF